MPAAWSPSTTWFVRWLIALLLSAGFVSLAFVLAGEPPWQVGWGRWALGTLGLLALGWAARGAGPVRRDAPGAMRTTAIFTGGLLGYVAIDAGAAAWFGRPFSLTTAGQTLCLAALLLVIFALALALLRALLNLPSPILAVARTVLDEALRMRIALVFVLLLLVLLAGLPFALNADQPLRYRLQTFMTYGLGGMGVLLSLMTVFLACRTLCGEIEERRIFTVLTKPVGRGAFLLGKWIGIVALNLVLVAVSGGAIFSFVYLLSGQPAHDPADARAVQQEILVARVAREPVPDADMEERIEVLFRETANRYPDQVQELGEAGLREQAREVVEEAWRSIGPHEKKTFVFENLQAARSVVETVQVRYYTRVSRAVPGNVLPVRLAINGREQPFNLRVGAFEIFDVPVDMIDEDGRLALSIQHQHPEDPSRTEPITLRFSPGDGLEVLYRAGGFTGNYLRGLAIIWIKLGFLAMLGLAASTFLGFPVASLTTLVFFCLAIMSGFIIESTEFVSSSAHAAGGLSALENATRWALRMLAQALAAYGAYTPSPLVVDGRLVTWGMVAGCAGWIGLVWCGTLGLVSWAVFNTRELARVQA